MQAIGDLMMVPADASDEAALNNLLELVSRLLNRPLVPGVGSATGVGADVEYLRFPGEGGRTAWLRLTALEGWNGNMHM
eukprot:2704891-Heterocapsa_arctica.AAC.1